MVQPSSPIPLSTFLSSGEFAPASRGQPGFQRSSGVSPSSGPRVHVSIIFRACVPSPCSAGAPSFSLARVSPGLPALLWGLWTPTPRSSCAPAWRPLCPWDGCLLDWWHGECSGGGRGAGRVLGCGCKGPGQECAHLAPCRGRGGLGGAARGGGGCFLKRLLFQSNVRFIASLWVSLGSPWVTPPLSVTHIAADGLVLVHRPQPGSAFPSSSLPQAPGLCQSPALLWEYSHSCMCTCLLVCGPCGRLAPAPCLQLSLLTRRYASFERLFLSLPDPSFPHPSLSSQLWGLSSVPRERAVGHSSKPMAWPHPFLMSSNPAPTMEAPAACWNGAEGFDMHVFKSVESCRKVQSPTSFWARL